MMSEIPSRRVRAPLYRWGRGVMLAALAAWAMPAAAHNPICVCEDHDETHVRCVGGFSDGSKAPGVTLDVIGYDETILLAGKLGDDSALVFKRPEGEFYILFDAGPGHVVEVDHSEIN
ncbi:MAG: hypothetical protein ACK4KV_05070 [Rhodocyclaceae bacterium]